MNDFHQPATKPTPSEDFYSSMLLKYKKEAKDNKKKEEEEIEEETQKILNLESRLEKKNRRFSMGRRLTGINDYINKKIDKIPKDNLASQISRSDRYLMDGGTNRKSKKLHGRGQKMRGRGGRMAGSAGKGLGPMDRRIAGALNDELENMGSTMEDLGMDFNDALGDAREELGLPSGMQEDELISQEQLKEAVEKVVKKYLKAAKTTKKAAKTAKAAKAAKAAKKAAQAAKVAKTAKNTKWTLNIIKGAGAFFSLESFGIALLVTIIVWIIQLLFAHFPFKSKYIPKLAGWEKLCLGLVFAFLAVLSFLPLLPFVFPFMFAYVGYASVIQSLAGMFQ